MVFNYIRVSTKEQNEQRQVDAMNEWNKTNNIDDKDSRMIIDKSTGTNIDRNGLKSILTFCRKGDVIVIKSIDRLSRNYKECKQLWEQITNTGADIVVIDMPILDTRQNKDLLGNLITDLFLTILGYVAQQENDFRRQRQREGIDSMLINEDGKRVSKKTGNTVGRPKIEYPDDFEQYYKQWVDKEITATKCMNILGLKRNTFYRLVHEYENKKGQVN